MPLRRCGAATAGGGGAVRTGEVGPRVREALSGARVSVAVIVTWAQFEQAEPALATRVRELFDAGRHKTIATTRADGSPRISGIECEFVDGQLQFGSMSGSRKGADLHRDPRFALHGPTFHPEVGDEAAWPGEAKIGGRAIPLGSIEGADGNPDGELFAADLTEVVMNRLSSDATLLVIEWWTPDRGMRRVERA